MRQGRWPSRLALSARLSAPRCAHAHFPCSCDRRADRIQALFGGYQARATTVDEALRRTGYAFKVRKRLVFPGEGALATSLQNRPAPRRQANENEFLEWTPEKLHLLVAHFLRVRFPMLLALNKVRQEERAMIKARRSDVWRHFSAACFSDLSKGRRQ